MKGFTCHIISVMSLIGLVLLLSPADSRAQKGVDLSGATIRAAKGDTVWVILNHVKPDKRQQFEKFIHEIFWPGAAKLGPAEQQAFRQTRVLHPAKPNEDGTYTYVFLMDPVIPNTSYSITKYLKLMYGEEKAKEYMKMFTESLNAPQVWYSVVQSEY